MSCHGRGASHASAAPFAALACTRSRSRSFRLASSRRAAISLYLLVLASWAEVAARPRSEALREAFSGFWLSARSRIF